MAEYVIGVDGGGTKTLAAAASLEGEVIGVARSGPSNFQTVGTAVAAASISDCIRGILLRTGSGACTQPLCRAVYYALAGADREPDFETIRGFVAPITPAQLWKVENDAMAALAVGSEDGTGVVVVCGTGTNCIGIGPDGRRVQVGGLGRVFGDCAGGTEIATRAYGAAVRGEDGRGKPTQLSGLIRRWLNISDLQDLAGKFYAEGDGFQLASLAPLVFEAAETGDEVARDILLTNARELGMSALAALRKLFPRDAAVRVVLTGGVARHPGSLTRDAMAEVILQEYPRARVVVPCAEPVLGAVVNALRLLGVKVDEAVMTKLESSLRERLADAETRGSDGEAG